MVSLTLRNIPEEILKRIRIFAAKNRRSMNSEMLIVLEEGLSRRISGETGNSGEGFGGTLSTGAFTPIISGEVREKIWQDLCGQWKDDRSAAELIADVWTCRDRGEK